MLVSTMSLTEMRDECLKEVQHYIDVAMIKYKQALRFRNKNMNKELLLIYVNSMQVALIKYI